MNVILEEQGDLILDIAGALAVITTCATLLLPGGMFNQLIQMLLQKAC